MKKVRFKFNDKIGSSQFFLDYELFDHSFSQKWLSILEVELKKQTPLRENLFFGAIFQNEDEIVEELSNAIRIVNAHGEEHWFKTKPRRNMDIPTLMKIHEEYEATERHPDFHKSLPATIRDQLLIINELIHKYETLTHNPEEFHFNFIFDNPLSYTLDNEDLNLFSPNHFDGWLYLDYGTTGVTILDAFNKKLPQRPVPQSTYQAGCKLLFDGDCERTPQYLEDLKNWMHEKWQMEFVKNETPLGYIPLGKLQSPFRKSEIIDQLKTHMYRPEVEIL